MPRYSLSLLKRVIKLVSLKACKLVAWSVSKSFLWIKFIFFALNDCQVWCCLNFGPGQPNYFIFIWSGPNIPLLGHKYFIFILPDRGFYEICAIRAATKGEKWWWLGLFHKPMKTSVRTKWSGEGYWIGPKFPFETLNIFRLKFNILLKLRPWLSPCPLIWNCCL